MQIRTSQMEGMPGSRCEEKGRRAARPLWCTPLPPSVLTNWEFSEPLDTAMIG